MHNTITLIMGKRLTSWDELHDSKLWVDDELNWSELSSDNCLLKVVWGEGNDETPIVGSVLAEMDHTTEDDFIVDMSLLPPAALTVQCALEHYGIQVEHGDVQLYLRPVWS